MTYNDKGTSFTRMGSFRQTTLTEKLADPQSAIIAGMMLQSLSFKKLPMKTLDFKNIFLQWLKIQAFSGFVYEYISLKCY